MAVRDLTPYTGRTRDEHRAIYVAVVSTRKRTLLMSGLGALTGLVPTMLLLPFLEGWSLLSIPACIILTVLLSERRGGRHLSVSRIAALDASVSARTGYGIRGKAPVNPIVGRILIAGEEPARGDIATLVPLVIPNPAPVTAASPSDPFAAELGERATPKPAIPFGHAVTRPPSRQAE